MSGIDSPLTGARLDEAKAALRAAALARRRVVPAATREAFAASLARQGVALAKRFEAKIVSAYMPIRDEPDTLPLLQALSDAGFATALPVTIERGSPLVFRQWRYGDRTTSGQMNIPEPPPEADAVNPDLLFTPLAAFDRRGHRIGYGAGHYDRSLQWLRSRGSAIAVGVAFSVSETAEAPSGEHDECLDFVLTERELIAITVDR
jgi:5-formyltetrahydrofolate cyclo-ligase